MEEGGSAYEGILYRTDVVEVLKSQVEISPNEKSMHL